MTDTTDVAASVIRLSMFGKVLMIVARAMNNEKLLESSGALFALMDSEARAPKVFKDVADDKAFFHTLVGWLDRNGHCVAAAYLNSLPSRA